jgi:RNA methyltransferase, TrmH family
VARWMANTALVGDERGKIAVMDALDRSMITSTSNPQVKRIRRLRSRKYREREGAFFVEGIQTVWQAVRNGANIEAIVIAPDLLRSDRASRMVLSQEKQGISVISLSSAAFESIAERENPSGLGALVRSEALILDGLDVTPRSVFIALDQVEKPGNVGSIIRSADAAGADGVIVVGESTDPYHPAAVKASMGTLFSVPVSGAETLDEVLEWAHHRSLNVVATSAHAGRSLWSVEYQVPTMIVFGSEGSGLDSSVLDRSDVTSVAIPMRGTATSLNLAVAVGILLYEVRRQQSAT